MVHTGKPSNGCAVCRKRKIKCDENKPSCSYCVRTSQPCPGYQHGFDLAWRDQRAVAKGHVQRRQKQRVAKARNTSVRVPPDNPVVVVEMSKLLQCYNGIAQSLTDERGDHAINFFFTTYARHTTETDRVMEIVLPLYLENDTGSTIGMSTLAVATLFHTAWLGRSPDSGLGRYLYLRAVSAMKKQLANGDQCLDDTMLASVLLLQVYETLVVRPRRARPTTEAHAHLEGALSLIKHRGLQNFTTPVAKGLVFDVRRQLIEESFRESKPPREILHNWAHVFDETEQPPWYRLDTINIDLAALEAEQHLGTQDALNMLEQALKIEEKLQNWVGSLPTHWLPTRVVGEKCIAPSIARAGLYQMHCDIYLSVLALTNWNTYRISLIKAQTIILSCSPTQTMCEVVIQHLVDDICASIPFLLGDRQISGGMGDRSIQYPTLEGVETSDEHYTMAPSLGIKLLGPLNVLLATNLSLRPGQKEWIGSQIFRIWKLYKLTT